MSKTTLKLYLSLTNGKNISKALDGFLNRTATYNNCAGKIESLILSLDEDNIDTEQMFLKAVASLQELINWIPCQDKCAISLRMALEITNQDADNDSFPSLIFYREFIMLAAQLHLQLNVFINAYSSCCNDCVDSGAYYYISDSNEIDVQAINCVAGVRPTITYRKGDLIGKTIANHCRWGIENACDNTMPEKTIMSLMDAIKNPMDLGDYCWEQGLESHIDITCYGIPNGTVSFQIEPAFFVFCSELKIGFMDVDLMI